VFVPRVYTRPATSLVPRPSLAPVFDSLQYAKTEQEGLVNLTTWFAAQVMSQILDMETYLIFPAPLAQASSGSSHEKWKYGYKVSWTRPCWQNRTRWQYATLPGSTASYGKCTQTSTFKNHTNLLAYLANWLLSLVPRSFLVARVIKERGRNLSLRRVWETNYWLLLYTNGFQGTIKRQGGPFPGFAQVFSALATIVEIKPSEWAPTKT